MNFLILLLCAFCWGWIWAALLGSLIGWWVIIPAVVTWLLVSSLLKDILYS